MELVRSSGRAARARKVARVFWAGAGLAAALYVIPGCSSNPGNPTDLKSLAKGEMKSLTVEAQPAPAPPTPFVDAAGKTHTLADFKGKAVVVNLWATWCAPCVQEMPTLAKLADETKGQPVAVVPISLDREDDRANAQSFIAKRPPLPFYNDPKFALAYASGSQGLPTTLLIDSSGLVRARVAGGADWSGPDALRVVEALQKTR
jgi:thiol-disulfide isomerase/thioredoxin